MPRGFIVALALLLPLSVFALDLSGTHLPYSDVRAGSPEAVGISLLTAEGVLQGNPDGTFRPKSFVNRAEFTKIAVELRTRFKPDESLPILHLPCFPDVPSESWFELPVCRAKAWGIVRGNAREGVPPKRWLFVPERTVNYAEALKILSEVYEVALPRADVAHNEDWYGPYLRASMQHGTLLPASIDPASPLRRGQVARLAAGFLSDSRGELAAYRAFERQQYVQQFAPSSASEGASSSSTSSVRSSDGSGSSASSVSSSSSFTLPTVNHFLIVGTASDAIADYVMPPQSEPSSIRAAEITLYNEVPSVDNIELRTDAGQLVGTLKKRTTNDVSNYRLIYQMSLDTPQYFAIPAGASPHVVARAIVRGLNDNGASDQLLQILHFTITSHGDTTNQTITNVVPAPFKSHQTAFGSVTSVTNAGPPTGSASSGTGQLVGRFAFAGSAIAGKRLLLENLVFSVAKAGVHLSNWLLTAPGSTSSLPCTVASGDAGTVSCSSIPAAIGLIGSDPLTLELRADIVRSGSGAVSLQASLAASGSPSDFGSVQWTDESGRFRWIEGTSPVATGTRWH